MAEIHGRIAFGICVKIKTPLMPDAAWMKRMVGMAEGFLKVALEKAVLASLQLMPGVKFEVSAANAKLEIEKVVP